MHPDTGAEGSRAATEPPIRVALIAPSLRYVGGQSAQAQLLLGHFQSDLEVDIRFIEIDPLLPRALSWAGRVPGVRTLLRTPIYCWNLWRGLEGVAVAHIFSASYWSFVLATMPAVWFAKRRGAKALVNYHSGEARDHLRRFRSAGYVLSRVDRIVVPSGYLVDVFDEFSLTTVTVPNFVDLTQFRYRQRVPLRPRLVCTRGFSAYYCVDVVVRAFARVKKAFPDAQLTLVGDGPLEPKIRRLVADLDLQGVRFTGVASRTEIARHYEEADIFVNASRLDNMPLSILEAFASGTPVVTTSPECMPYLVEHGRTGMLSAVGDSEALATNVIRVIEEPALAALLSYNALLEARKYTWSDVRRRWLEVYGGG